MLIQKAGGGTTYEIRHQDDPPGTGEGFGSAQAAVDFMNAEVGVRMNLWKGKKLLARYSPSERWSPGREPLAGLPRPVLKAIEETMEEQAREVRGVTMDAVLDVIRKNLFTFKTSGGKMKLSAVPLRSIENSFGSDKGKQVRDMVNAAETLGLIRKDERSAFPPAYLLTATRI